MQELSEKNIVYRDAWLMELGCGGAKEGCFGFGVNFSGVYMLSIYF